MSFTQSCVCPGCAEVFSYNAVTDTTVRIGNTDNWTIDASITESPRKRNSSTNRKEKKFCANVVSFDANVTTTICAGDWLFCKILENNNMGQGVCGWWLFSWECTYIDGTNNPAARLTALQATLQGIQDGTLAEPATIPHTIPGVLLFGEVTPGGFGLDNTTQDVAASEWSISVYAGPYMPQCNPDGSLNVTP